MLKFETSDGRVAWLLPSSIKGILPSPEQNLTVLSLEGGAFLTVKGETADIAQYCGVKEVVAS